MSPRVAFGTVSSRRLKHAEGVEWGEAPALLQPSVPSIIGAQPVDKIETDVLAVLQRIWQAKPDAGSRLRRRVERIPQRSQGQWLWDMGRERTPPHGADILKTVSPFVRPSCGYALPGRSGLCRGVREGEAVGHRFGLVEQIAAD